VDDERLAGRTGQLDLRLERALLVGARRVVAKVVQARLADGDAAGVLRERLQLRAIGLVEAGGRWGGGRALPAGGRGDRPPAAPRGTSCRSCRP
jgi:hypothetical protein